MGTGVRVGRRFGASWVWTAVVALAAGVLPGVVTMPSAGATPTCTIYLTGGTTAAGRTLGNWSLTSDGPPAGRLPGASDFVCTSSTSPNWAVVVPYGHNAIAGINFSRTEASIEVKAGTFAVGSSTGAFDSLINKLILDAGTTLDGTANLTLTGPWASRSTITDATLNGKGVLTANALDVNGMTLDHYRRLLLQGVALHKTG